MNSSSFRWSSLLFVAGLACAGCGRSDPAAKDEDVSAAGTVGTMEVDLARTLKEQPGFYVFKTTADFAAETQGLKWEDGSENPEFADLNAKRGGTAHGFLQDFPRTLRYYGPDATGGIRPYLLDFVQPYLVHMHPNVPGSYYAGLAQSWAMAPDHATVFFKIDPAARWSDGKPVTTDDFVFMLYFMRSPFLGEPWYNDFYTKTFSRLTVYDKHSLAMTLAEPKPDPVFPFVENSVPLPRHAFQDFGPNWLKDYQWRILPTLSPYTLTEKDIEKGQSITFTRQKDWWAQNKRFWRGRYNPDRYRYDVIRDIDKAFEAFRRGDLDAFPITSPTFWYEKLPNSDELVQNGYVAKSMFYTRTPQPNWGLWINRSKPILDNRDVREGLNFATNFQLVCSQFYRGDAVVQQTNSDGYGWNPNPAIHARAFDPVKARELFAKAGFTKQGPDGVLMNEKEQRLSFVVTAYKYPGADEILALLKREAIKAGVEYGIDIQDQTTAWKKVQEKNHEIAYIALSRPAEPYPKYWEIYHGSNAYEDVYLDATGKQVDKTSLGSPNPAPKKVRVQTNNMTMTFLPELDALIEEYDRAQTMADIKRLAAVIEQKLHDDAAWIPGWAQPFYRSGYWRWVKWPKDFNVMQSRYPSEFFLSWIDEDVEKATRAARKDGKTFPPEIHVFDQYKTP